ncbi:MAG: glycosyltransferase family 9 protein [Elusimicrobia bacterium]|nr:glycosyltransferase family 9 protein [Elusimicrobiota bacterium]
MKILVIQLKRIGDVILTTPVFDALRRRYPQAQIDFLVESPSHEAVRDHPCLNRVLIYDPRTPLRWIAALRREGYDWVIDFLGTPRSAIIAAASGAAVKAGPGHVFSAWAYSHKFIENAATEYAAVAKLKMLAQLGLELPARAPELYFALSPDEKDQAARQLQSIFPGAGRVGGDYGPHEPPLIGLAPHSRRITRQWPQAHFIELGRRITRQIGADLIVFWGPGEKAEAKAIAAGIGDRARACPQTKTLNQLGAYLWHCDALVTNCNGPRHIATALGIPTLTVHGSSDPAAWNPPPENAETENSRFPFIRREDLFCIGCRKNRCPYELQCLRDLSPQVVFDKLMRLLQRRKIEAYERG